MIIVALMVFGLIFGSFVNALVWRIHEQDETPKSKRKKNLDLSILNGRSMCPHCHHELGSLDLVPVFSWLWLKGKCRYCKAPISPQYPVVELLTSILFVLSYVYWPYAINSSAEVFYFGLWLLTLTGLVALTVYDVLWYLLPNRIIVPLSAIGACMAVIRIMSSDNRPYALMMLGLAIIVGGGIFYLLFQVSNGKWIGGGDVKLGWLIGLLVLTPSKAILAIFIAALLGTIISLPLLMQGKLKRTAIIPFGPFLIAGTYIVMLWGTTILDWYMHAFIIR